MRAAQTDPQEPGVYVEEVETAPFEYVILSTYGRSAHWTLRAEHTDPQEPEL
jgi:hypothetical protein